MGNSDTTPIANFDFTLDDLSEEQAALLSYWRQAKGQRLMPKRADFDPVDLPKVIPYLSLEDVTYDPVRFQVRLVGGATSSARNSKGKYLDEFPGTEDVIDMLKQMLKRKQPYHYISNINWDDRSYKTYSSLVVPFSNDGDKVTLAMACHHTLAITKYD